MPLSANHIHFFVSYAVAFVVFGLIGKWYLWPAIKERAPAIAFTPLLLYACFARQRPMPGLVSPQLPRTFHAQRRSTTCSGPLPLQELMR